MNSADNSGRAPFPTKADIVRFVKEADGKVTKREIARAFKLRGQDRVTLKHMLRELMDEGALEKDPGKAIRTSQHLPSVTVIEVIGTDPYGEPLARPLHWDKDGQPPRIYLAPDRKKRRIPALGRGDRALARLSLNDDQSSYTGRVIKKLDATQRQLLGVFRGGELGGRITPVDKRQREEFIVSREDTGGARDGDLVVAEIQPRRHDHRIRGLKAATVKERLGDVSKPKSISLIAIHAHGIPTEFSRDAIEQAEQARQPVLDQREDLRHLPMITIDPADARDHDDAVFAEPDRDTKDQTGWHVVVAIADVAHYVRNGTALDKEALNRGNSAYFPDRVVPMLPEVLSADLCSLKPGQDRAVLAVHMWFDPEGRKRHHRFSRALIRSEANLSYEAVQIAVDGNPDNRTADLVEPVLKPLYGAWRALMKAREIRAPLDLDMPERQVVLNAAGEVEGVFERERLDSHRLVEEFMIAANVCAAETLEQKAVPCMYRVHEEPTKDKLESFREFLGSIDMNFAKAQVMKPVLFNRILAKVEGTAHDHLVNEVVLRTQTQAYYSPENKGHFGLALPRYAHFTSPIRRYADVLVHRGLIRALKMGPDGLSDDEAARMDEMGEHISNTERRAMAAERDSNDRYLAAYLAARVGQTFAGRISGVTRFGLFVTLEPVGGDGLVPVSSLVGDYYIYEEHKHALIGKRFGHVYRLGDRVDVRLVEATPVSGGLKLELVGEASLPDFVTDAPKRSGRQLKSRRKGGKKKNPKKRQKAGR